MILTVGQVLISLMGMWEAAIPSYPEDRLSGPTGRSGRMVELVTHVRSLETNLV
jgi:hypothetical protein